MKCIIFGIISYGCKYMYVLWEQFFFVMIISLINLFVMNECFNLTINSRQGSPLVWLEIYIKMHISIVAW